MPKKRFQPGEIIGQFRHADVRLGQGKQGAEGVKARGGTAVTDSRWRQAVGGMTTHQANRMKQLVRETGQLLQSGADLTVDTLIRPEAARGTG